ncbi:hypothetical protein [Streptomyces sp. NPDC048338]|uniref:hypothetical protein n=1 Tax=Streptomyces sp. NPDC048338 TaxID=3365536 RepID=UPI00371A94EB
MNLRDEAADRFARDDRAPCPAARLSARSGPTATPAAAPEPTPSTPEGDLATTGPASGPGAAGVAGAALLIGGGPAAYAVHRRRARTS